MPAPCRTPRPLSSAERVETLTRFARLYEKLGCATLALATWDEVLKQVQADRRVASGAVPSVREAL